MGGWSSWEERARAAISISRKPKNGAEGKGKNAKNDRWGRKKCGAASFIALFKSRRGTDQRLRGVEKEIRFSPPTFFLPFRYISNKIFRDPPNLAH